jgi:molybdate/tungstate transport system substrate-binding protein
LKLKMLAVGLGCVAAATAISAGGAAASTSCSGTVDVLAAGSLSTVLQNKIDPAFQRATGCTVTLTTHGSSALATSIKNGEVVGDVFLSASPKVTRTLEGNSNGDWVSWYEEFAESPQVLAYNPGSHFRHGLLHEAWYKVITEKGFIVERTDPATDPGGVLAEDTMKAAARKFSKYRHALDRIASSSSSSINGEEDAEQASIQTGQADAAFMYESDAISQNSPWVNLSGVPTQYGKYTVTILKNAPDGPAAKAFVKFILSSQGAKLLKSEKFHVISPAEKFGKVPSGI